MAKLQFHMANETTMSKSSTHKRMIIGSSIWQLKNKIINR